MDTTRSLDKFICPLGGQEVELQQVDYEAGGMPLMRLRIRERGARFTIFDFDPGTAERWGKVMFDWARTQERK
jgi:hypothetical protein